MRTRRTADREHVTELAAYGPDIVEAHVSLWCARPRVSIMLQVKP